MLLEIFHGDWDNKHHIREHVSVTGMNPFTIWDDVHFKVREAEGSIDSASASDNMRGAEGGIDSASTSDNNKDEAEGSSAFSASREDM